MWGGEAGAGGVMTAPPRAPLGKRACPAGSQSAPGVAGPGPARGSGNKYTSGDASHSGAGKGAP